MCIELIVFKFSKKFVTLSLVNLSLDMEKQKTTFCICDALFQRMADQGLACFYNYMCSFSEWVLGLTILSWLWIELMAPPNSALFTVLCKSLCYLISIWFGHDYFFFALIWFMRLCRASIVSKLSFTLEYNTQFPSMQYFCFFSLLLFWLLLMYGWTFQMLTHIPGLMGHNQPSDLIDYWHILYQNAKFTL